MSKDFAKSYKQKHWEYAVSIYERMQKRIVDFPMNAKIQQYAKDRVSELEKEYPQLKKG